MDIRKSRPAIPTSAIVTTSDVATNISAAATEVILCARSSNVQAISLNVTTAVEPGPTNTGGSAIVLFPGESIQLPTNPSPTVLLQVKYIIFNDTGTGNPDLEITEIIP